MFGLRDHILHEMLAFRGAVLVPVTFALRFTYAGKTQRYTRLHPTQAGAQPHLLHSRCIRKRDQRNL